MVVHRRCDLSQALHDSTPRQSPPGADSVGCRAVTTVTGVFYILETKFRYGCDFFENLVEAGVSTCDAETPVTSLGLPH